MRTRRRSLLRGSIAVKGEEKENGEKRVEEHPVVTV